MPNKTAPNNRIDRDRSEDERLLASFLALKKGDQTAFAPFYEGTKRRVYYNILSLLGDPILSEDLLQETYLRFLERIGEIDEGKNPLGFLMVTSRNLALDALRESKKVALYDEAFPPESGRSHPDLSSLDEAMLLARIKRILKPKEFEILLKHVYLEMTFKEIAHFLHRPLGSVLWAYNNAIKKLRKELPDEERR